MQIAKRGRDKTMNTKTPNTRKKFRKLKRYIDKQKVIQAIVPNKQVGKWSELQKIFVDQNQNKQ